MSLALFQMHDEGFQSELAIRTQTRFSLRGCCRELDLGAYTFHACVSLFKLQILRAIISPVSYKAEA
jgi:hypothetical protein